jgi:DNA-binding GntR family transcriptional regulator
VLVVPQPKAKVNQEDVAYRAIIRIIVDNQVRPGDYLLETSLAESLGLSRTPVSHALDRLLAEGFLEKRSKRGYILPLPSPEDARQVFSVRQLLEGQAAAEAAVAVTPQEVAILYQYLQECDDAVKRGDKEYFSTNSYLERYVRQIFWRSNLYIFFFDGFYHRQGNSRPIQKTPEQHRRIVEAIEAKEPALANRLMREHVLHTYNSMVSAL